jgi:hypothetical protein
MRPTDVAFERLPGGDLVAAGLSDLAAGLETEAAMLMASATPRLEAAGIRVPPCGVQDPERRLYELIEARVGPSQAHSTYNAVRRRVLSFLRSLDAVTR